MVLLRQQLGVAGVVIDAEDERVSPIYQCYDFERLGAGSRRLFLPLGRLESVLERG